MVDRWMSRTMTNPHHPLHRLGLSSSLLLLLLCLAFWATAQTTNCKPGENCKPPDCRCWNDEGIPGGIPLEETPQVVLLTFEYAVNSGNVDPYLNLFKNLVNPNNCPAVGTFFVQEVNSDMSVVKSLFDNGHEIGVTSANGTVPRSETEWIYSLKELHSKLMAAGIPQQKVVGVRAPELKPGGNDEFMAMALERFVYDASCTLGVTSLQESLMWPYTYDFAPGPQCDYGDSPTLPFPGMWQVVVGDLEFNGTKCASPSGCADVNTQWEAFNLFYDSFIQHYKGKRSPFNIVINPQWLLVDYKMEGTVQFLHYIRAAFPDTWILTVNQVLEWVRNPVTNAKATAGGYAPWNCV